MFLGLKAEKVSFKKRCLMVLKTNRMTEYISSLEEGRTWLHHPAKLLFISLRFYVFLEPANSTPVGLGFMVLHKVPKQTTSVSYYLVKNAVW